MLNIEFNLMFCLYDFRLVKRFKPFSFFNFSLRSSNILLTFPPPIFLFSQCLLSMLSACSSSCIGTDQIFGGVTISVFFSVPFPIVAQCEDIIVELCHRINKQKFHYSEDLIVNQIVYCLQLGYNSHAHE